MTSKQPTPEQLMQKLSYDPDTGQLIWKACRDPKRIGSVAKCLDAYGYVQVFTGGTMLKGHRIAWALHYGKWPDGPIDHINGVRHDNRIVNLRMSDSRSNAENQRNGTRQNTTGFMGVFVSKRSKPSVKYRAKIEVNGKQIHLGGFPSPEAAHEAYLTAKRQLHAACTI